VSRKLQAVENDLTQAIKDVTVALSALEHRGNKKYALENMRSEGGFQKIIAEASLLAEHHGIAVSSPRLSKGRSVYRPTVGVEGDCAETYYRINGHQQRVGLYSVASAVDSDCSRTAPGHCYGSTQQLQQRQVSKRLHRLLSILGTLPVTTCESERVFCNADVDPFYCDAGSTRGASLAATPGRALSYARRRAQRIF